MAPAWRCRQPAERPRNNYLPDIDVQPIAASAVRLARVFPKLHTFGADLAIPTPWVTLKSEAAYFKSPSGGHNEYVLYVVELERQRGEWVFDGGYIGEAVTRSVAGSPPRFAPDEGVAKSIIARASYTVDPRRTVAIQGAVRQSGDGFYLQGEYSQAVGQHWRATLSIVGLGGRTPISSASTIGILMHRLSFDSVFED